MSLEAVLSKGENVLDYLVANLRGLPRGLEDYVPGFVREVYAEEPKFNEFSSNRGRYEYALDSFLRFGECQDVLLEGLLKYFFLKELSERGIDEDLIEKIIIYDKNKLDIVCQYLLREVFHKDYGPSLIMECIEYTFSEDESKPSEKDFYNSLFDKYGIPNTEDTYFERTTIERLVERLDTVKRSQKRKKLYEEIEAGKKEILEILNSL